MKTPSAIRMKLYTILLFSTTTIAASTVAAFANNNNNNNKLEGLQIIGSFQRTEKVVEHEGDSDTNCNWVTWNSP